MEKILIPVDFSDCSLNATVYALKLAKRWQIEITLLHLLQLPSMPLNAPLEVFINLEGNLTTDKQKHLEEFWGQAMRLAKADPSEHAVKFAVRKNYDLHAIINFASENASSMILMGTKGASGIGKMIGTNAGYVLKNAGIPVLLVPNGYEFIGLSRILVTEDYKTDQNLDTWKILREMAMLYASEIEVIHIGENLNHNSSLEKINERFIDKNTMVYASQSQAANLIKEHSEDQHVDLVVIQPHRYGVFERLNHKSVSKELSFASKVPILAIR